MTLIDALDSTSGWSASSGSVATDSTSGHFVQGSSGLKYTVTINGSANISKTFSVIPFQEKNLRVTLWPDTLSNVTRATIQIESSVGNSVTYYIPVANLTAATLNFIDVDFRNTPDAISGTFIQGSVTKIYLGVTTSSSQALNWTWDYLRQVEMYSLVNSQSAGMIIPIYDSTNLETMVIVSESGTTKGRYTLASTLSNSYALASSVAKFFTGSIGGQSMNFDPAQTGTASKQTHAIRRQYLPNNLVNKNLLLSATFSGDKFQVNSIPTTNSLTISGNYTTRFLSGDSVVLFKFERNYPKWASYYNSSVGSNFMVLTLSGNSTYSAPLTTLPVNETINIGADPVSSWYITRLSLFLKYFVGNMTANEVLSTATINGFYPLDANTAASSTLYSTLFPNKSGWTTFFSNTGDASAYNNWILGGTSVIGFSTSITCNIGGGFTNETADSIVTRNLENYTASKLPVEIRFRYACFPGGGGGGHGGQSMAVMFSTDGTADYSLSKGTGIYIHFTNNTGSTDTVYFRGYVGGSPQATVNSPETITNPVQPTYDVAMRIYNNKLQAKIWQYNASEPASWQYDIPINFVQNGNFINIYGNLNATGAVNNPQAQALTNFSVKSLATGYVIYSTVTAQSGQKLVLDAELTRQDTSTDMPSIRKFGGILV
jgi:hypothetical protein